MDAGTKITTCKDNKKSCSKLSNIIFHSLLALTCSLLCSYPYWRSFSMRQVLFLSFPIKFSSFLSHKCLFIIVNIIVMLVIGESKLLGSNSSSSISPVNEIYDEYVERSRGLRRGRVLLLPRKKLDMMINLVHDQEIIQDKEVIIDELPPQKDDQVEMEEEDNEEFFEEAKANKNENEKEDLEEEEEEKVKERDEEESGMPTEELNRRVEEFIARVNKQRWLESRSLICCEA